MRSGHDFSRQHHASRLYPPSSGSFVAMNSLAATTAVGRYAKLCIATPMHSCQLGIVPRRLQPALPMAGSLSAPVKPLHSFARLPAGASLASRSVWAIHPQRRALRAIRHCGRRGPRRRSITCARASQDRCAIAICSRARRPTARQPTNVPSRADPSARSRPTATTMASARTTDRAGVRADTAAAPAGSNELSLVDNYA